MLAEFHQNTGGRKNSVTCGVDAIGVGFVPITTVHNKEPAMQDAFMMVSILIQGEKQKFELYVADKTLNMRHNIGLLRVFEKRVSYVSQSI